MTIRLKYIYIYIVLMMFSCLYVNANTSSKQIGVANTQGLNVRQKPNTSGAILHVLKQNETVLINYEADNGWVNISFTNNDIYYEGFVNKKYLEIKVIQDETLLNHSNFPNIMRLFGLVFLILSIIVMVFSFRKRLAEIKEQESKHKVLNVKDDFPSYISIFSAILFIITFFLFTRKFFWIQSFVNLLSLNKAFAVILIVVLGGFIVFYLNTNSSMYVFFEKKTKVYYILIMLLVTVSSLILSIKYFGSGISLEKIVFYEYSFTEGYIAMSIANIASLLFAVLFLNATILKFNKKDIAAAFIAASISIVYLYFIVSLIVVFIIAILPFILLAIFILGSGSGSGKTKDRKYYSKEGNYTGYIEPEDAEGVAVHRNKHGQKVGYSKKVNK